MICWIAYWPVRMMLNAWASAFDWKQSVLTVSLILSYKLCCIVYGKICGFEYIFLRLSLWIRLLGGMWWLQKPRMPMRGKSYKNKTYPVTLHQWSRCCSVNTEINFLVSRRKKQMLTGTLVLMRTVWLLDDACITAGMVTWTVWLIAMMNSLNDNWSAPAR